ncbi:MAG: Gldg family protein [Spirochaetales bacterium]|uniref:Gldg family protein n=1 Tax=Candidatus Thalassospirochaeta sargassi TaxID=3119039 RepID=A0AAJ1IAP9_9SPIO|nr:Gldg family protein [Spirochaetales bacterium]
MKRKTEIIRFALYALVIVLLNIAMQTAFFRIDLTENGTYSLTDISRRMVSELEEPLTIKVYITENLPSPYNNLEQNLQDILGEYALSGNRNFNYDIYPITNLDEDNAGASSEIEDEAKSYGINPIQIQQVDQSEINLTSAYMGIAFIHADMIETIPVINPNENIEYVLTSTVMKMQEKTSRLLALDEDISMKLYLSSSLIEMSPELAAYSDQLQDVVDSLNKVNYNRISYEWIDPDTSGAPDYEKYGFAPLQLQDADGSIIELYGSAVMEYGGNSTSFDVLNRGLFGGYTIQDPAAIEDQLNGVVERLIGVGNKVAWLSDHGTIQLYGNSQQQYGEPSVASFLTLASSRYSLEPVALSTDLIPDDAGSMIIARPQPFQPYSEWDLYQIDQFLMNGGDVAVFMDGFMEYIPQQQGQMQQQQPIYIPRNTGLEKLLEHYGAKVGQSYVMDENCFHQQQQGESGIIDMPIYFAPQIAADNINSNLPYLDGIKGLIMLNSSPIEINENLPEGRTAEVLFSSSDESWLVEDTQQINLYNPMMIMPPGSYEDGGNYPLAVVLEGNFTSYFADKGVPDKPAPAEGEGEALSEEYQIKMDRLSKTENMTKATDSGRLFVFGSSLAISDNLVDQSGTATNSIMILNILDEMNGNGDFALMRKKGLNYSPLNDTEPGMKTFIRTFNMVIIPVFVIVAGLLVWLGWSRRKRKIAAMFQEAEDE